MLVELMGVASAPKKEKKVITMCHEALVDQLRDELDENKVKDIRSFNSNRSYHGYRWKWEDGEIRENELRSKLNSFRRRKVEHFKVSPS